MRALILLPVAVGLAAQAPLRLERPDAEFPEPFSRIIGLRELSDGRIIVTDALEQSIARLNFRTGDITLIGRQGNGPGEFGTPGQLFPLPGDTTLMLDFANARGLVITPGGTISSHTVSFASADAGFVVFPRAVDARGRYYGTAPLQLSGGSTELPDSVPIVRWSPTGGTDTMFRMPNAAAGNLTVRVGPGGTASFGGRRQAFNQSDEWVLAPDGRIGIVRVTPYRVEWLGIDGRRSAGPTVAFEPVRITQRDREAWAEGQGGRQMVMRTPQGTRTMRSQAPDLDQVDFPEFKPPWDNVTITPEGDVWVRVSRSASADRQLYDVFDAQGRRVRQVELGPGRRLIGFGQGTLYAVRVDADDLQWIERYRRPGP